MTETTTTDTTTEFCGWPADATTFLAELTDDNSREFWTANTHRYRAALLEPTRALAAATPQRWSPDSGRGSAGPTPSCRGSVRWVAEPSIRDVIISCGARLSRINSSPACQVRSAFTTSASPPWMRTTGTTPSGS